MGTQEKQALTSQTVLPADDIAFSYDFEQWAKAVRKQMLSCLRKREERSPSV